LQRAERDPDYVKTALKKLKKGQKIILTCAIGMYFQYPVHEVPKLSCQMFQVASFLNQCRECFHCLDGLSSCLVAQLP